MSLGRITRQDVAATDVLPGTDPVPLTPPAQPIEGDSHARLITPGGWTDYAREMQDAGAAAIELNACYLPGDPTMSGRDVEQRQIDVLQRVKDAVTVPVAVNLSPHFSSTDEIALRVDEAGADALVLSIASSCSIASGVDTETLAVVHTVALFAPCRRAAARTWIALLRGMLSALAATMEGSKTPPTVTATHPSARRRPPLRFRRELQPTAP